MSINQNHDDKFLITLSDVVSLFRTNKFKILVATLLLGLLGGFYALTQPIQYKVEGTFKEKNNKSGNMGGSLSQLLSGDMFSLTGTGTDHESAALIKSRKLMKNVIDQLNLQATLIEPSNQEGLVSRIKNNLKVEWAIFTKSPYPVLKDFPSLLQLEKVEYEGEIPLMFDLDFKSNQHFLVMDQFKQEIGQGELGKPFQIDQLSFTLNTYPEFSNSLKSKKYTLTINSLANTVAFLSKELEVENVKTDKTLLKFSFEHRDRHLASRFINALMENYQDYLKKNHDRIASIQLDYLHLREEESAQKLAQLMQKHADFISADLSSAGFADYKQEIEFLAESEHRFKDKLLSNELEIKRLQSINPNRYAYYDQLDSGSGDHLVINEMLREMRAFKQEQESLELALRQTESKDSIYLEKAFAKQLDEIQQLHRYSLDLKKMMEKDELGIELDFDSPLIHDSRFLIKSWYDKIKEKRTTDIEEWKKIKGSFSSYLENLARVFQVHQKILQDRLTHQQNPSGEYQGINLETAKILYVDHCKNLLNIESEIRQNKFFIDQLEDPNFEITALSVSLRDPVSLDMINQTAAILLKLKDYSNQSMREQERLKEELNLQRLFLKMHLKQMGMLMKLNHQLISEKIDALHIISLELIRQKIGLIEKNLKEYVISRLDNFKLERSLIQEHLDQIRQEMAKLPARWMMEQLIDQQVDVNQLIVKEIAKMVESKNISHHLEVIQSAPLDTALPSIHPIPPSLRFYTILGGTLGAFLSIGLILTHSLIKGMTVSQSNLKIMNQHISGELSNRFNSEDLHQIPLQNLNTLRRLQSYFDQERLDELGNFSSVLLLLIEGTGPQYHRELAQLLRKKGEKVLTIELDFKHSSEKPGLLQYLEGKIDDPMIRVEKDGDYLEAGGESQFSIELLKSQRFRDLLNQLKEKYDWILAFTQVKATEGEAESLIQLFPFIAVTIKQESIEDLSTYTHLSSHSNKKVTFIFAQ
jgi:tyrosine-protein kinase Etk/Wzc